MSTIQTKIKTIFFGTPKFGVPSLKALNDDPFFDVIAVVTNLDKPVGRKKELTPPPIKIYAQENNIEVFQQKGLKKDEEFLKKFENINPDLCVVVSYGKIISQNYLDVPKYGFVNIHPSILPRYRGATPIQSAIFNGDKETAVTIMQMDEGMDTGPILSQKKVLISDDDNFESLAGKLSSISVQLLPETLKKYIKGEIKPQTQSEDGVTIIKKYSRDDAKIDWQLGAREILNKIRALNPEPGTWTSWDNKVINILEAGVIRENRTEKPGIVVIEEGKILVSTDENMLELKKLQLEGKKVVEARDFISGYPKFNTALLK